MATPKENLGAKQQPINEQGKDMKEDLDVSTAENNVAVLYPLLSGGGEMGALIRNKDWSKKELGDIGSWPLALLSTVSIMLNSRFPMFLFWGSESVCFYNDAYRVSLGSNGKHPALLGGKGQDHWKETWHTIKPLIDQILNGGESSWNEDQLVPIYRNNTIEDVYWTFSYSPVKEQSGNIAGVLVTCFETTSKVTTQLRIEEARDQLQFALEAAELGTWDYTPSTGTFIANNRLKKWLGLPHDAEIQLHQAIDAIVETDREKVLGAIRSALESSPGKNYMGEFAVTSTATTGEKVLRATGKARFSADKMTYRFCGTLQDITEQVQARKKIEESERQFKNVLLNSPNIFLILTGSAMIISFVNEPLLASWGKTRADILNLPIIEAIPEIKDQPFPKMLAQVFNTGNIIFGKEEKAVLIKNGQPEDVYYDFVYQPMFGKNNKVSGITVMATDVTEQVRVRKKIEEQEEQLRIALKGGELGTFDYYPQSGELLWSAKTKEFFGLPQHADVNMDMYLQAIHPDDRESSGNMINQPGHLQDDGLYELEYRTVGVTDGKLRWLRSKGIASFDMQGKPVRYTGIVQEITKRRQAEESLKESEEKYRSLILGLPVAIYTCNAEGRIQLYNDAAVQLWGNKPQLEKELWCSSLDICKADGTPIRLEERPMVIALQEGRISNTEIMIKRPDGTSRNIVQFPQPQFNAQGDITGAINTLIDITEQKKKEQQKDDFISIASHEMMTPITTAKGYIQLMELSLGTENDTALLYAGKTKKSVERLHTLITELLDASKLQHGQLNYHISTFAFNEMLYETIESMRQISPSHLIIKTGDYSGLVTGDKERLQQVMNNLLSNAIKYSPNVNEINVNIEFKENMLAISVRDYGMGMSEQHLEKIFERYYRVQEHAGSFHGLGMGLYISYNIIRRHGGKMWAISQPGAGSTFYFTIPVKPVVK